MNVLSENFATSPSLKSCFELFFADNIICRNSNNHLQPLNVWRSCLFEFYGACYVLRTVEKAMLANDKNDDNFQEACRLTAEFAKKEGRQPRIMIAKMGQDGHDRGAKW